MHWSELDAFTRAYCEAALWTATDGDGEPLDSEYGIEDFSPEALEQAKRECDAFRAAAGAMLEDWEDSQAGHDFSLTRNGHGAGFWDRDRTHWNHELARDEPMPFREELSKLASEAGERDLYPQRGMLYFEPSERQIAAGAR